MANQTGITISIKAWLPTGKGLDEQFAALSLVKTAHETGNYAPLLSAAKIEAVSTEQKTRRFEDVPANPTPAEPSSEQTGSIASSSDQSADGVSAHLPEAAIDPAPEPAATDDAIAERPSLTETDGTVTEPAAEPDLGIIETPKRKRA